MKEFIQSLINGYDAPVFFSDAHQGTILYSNEAAHRQLGFSEEQLTGRHLDDLFKNNRIIQNQPIWEREEEHYLVQNEELSLSGSEYIKSVLKPFPKEAALYYLTFQKEMAGRLVHRLHSPLNGTLGFSELLKATDLDENQARYIQAIESGLNDLKSVLAEIQVLGKNVSAHKTTVDMNLLAEQVIDSLPEEQKLRMQLVMDKQVENLHTDFILLKSIIEEFLQNAVIHGPQDQSSITLHFMPDRIRVNNEGPPISESLAGKIFCPFFSSKAQHIGIGLAKCTAYAYELDYELKLAENSTETGISFDILFADSAVTK